MLVVKWQPAYRFQRERTKVSIELLEATVKAISLHIPWLKKNKKHVYPPTSKKTWASSPTVTWRGHRTLLLTFALGAEGAAWLASIPAVTLFLPSAGTTRAVTDTQQGLWLSKCLRADRSTQPSAHTERAHQKGPWLQDLPLSSAHRKENKRDLAGTATSTLPNPSWSCFGTGYHF